MIRLNLKLIFSISSLIFVSLFILIIAHFIRAANLTDNTKVTVPSNLIATGHLGRNVIVFSDNSDNESGFQLYTSKGDIYNWNLLATLSPNENSFIHTGIDDNYVYYYKVIAFDSEFNYSESSNVDFSSALEIEGPIHTTVGDYEASTVAEIVNYIENILGPGDTLLIRGGTYFASGEWNLGNSGTPGNPIVVKGYGEETVIIDQSGSANRAIEWGDATSLSNQNTLEIIKFYLNRQ